MCSGGDDVHPNKEITTLNSNNLINRLSLTFITKNITLLFTCYNTRFTRILLLGWPPCFDGMRIVGRWCFTPCIEAKETLDYVP